MNTTTKQNKKAKQAINKITLLTISMLEHERVEKLWQIRNTMPKTESMRVFKKNMELIDENNLDHLEAYERLLKI